MKIKITTTLGKTYSIIAKEKNFEELVEKIMEKKYIMLDSNTIVLSHTIAEIKKVSK